MKRVAGGIGVIVLAGVLFAGVASAGISGTSHDFSGRAWNTSSEICGICHIPHHAGSISPLWNHTLSSQSFSWTATKSWGGTDLPTNISSWAGTSKLCLSCHDGTVAVGDLIHNGFGSSEFVTGDAVVTGTGGSLDGNHPVAVPYPYQNQANTYNGNTTGSGVVLTEFVGSPSNVRLYSDNSGVVSVGGSAGKTGIECGSCHDPHDNTNDPFLRDTNSGSQICIDCHSK